MANQPKFIPFEHLDKIGEIAVYYGFAPMKSPAISKADLDAAKGLLDGDYIDDETESHGRLPLHAEEKISIIRAYHSENMHALPQPVMLYYKDPCRNSKRSHYHRYADLEILGASGPIAEAALIQTGRAMLAAEGYENTMVEINSIGDHDSIVRFVKELTAYYRKNINDMTPECRQLFKTDPFELLSSHDDSCRELNAGAPRAMDFLSETSRRHLEEILEYLETLEIPYRINNGLIGNRKYCTETVFSIVNADDSQKGSQHILAVGARYNGLSKRLNMKRDIQGVGLSLLIKENKSGLRKPLTKLKRPIASFIQLGLESKLLSLQVIEALRQVKIPLYVSLAKDRLGAQVSSIEKYHTPYIIVMGKKEAVDRTVIVRRTDTHSQDIVPLSDLPKYMKKIEDQYFKK
ncbi:MAG: ATP phosphoribosyltransferase regulatory subunit [Patescibacteria group bacterium]|nr:ATP phosphoribosyltransferase regulatory subunit [Patescibacteria group bacterium]MDE1940857.1 ATP phosphoribosyltransferase regulatory subunit [Patescibacteria group bacterium]MDE1966450.1 ATP phosphoribosyltransferase regulatory subunit [Patescibacteria group bacterium]